MKQDPGIPGRNQQPEDGTNEDLNLTNRDATLVNNTRNRTPDAATMSDQAGADALNDNLTASPSKGDEINPEYGDAADPTFEAM